MGAKSSINHVAPIESSSVCKLVIADDRRGGRFSM